MQRVYIILAILFAFTLVGVAAPTTRPAKKFKITYKLTDGSDNWDPKARATIIKSVDRAVALYNDLGEFDKVLTVEYNTGTPTADGNYNGHINFGTQMTQRTAQHEIAHTLGVGQYRTWQDNIKDGIWTGKAANAQLKEFNGADAVLHADKQHFWPYGLNYEVEASPENFRRNVLMVAALRKDMGIVNGKN